MRVLPQILPPTGKESLHLLEKPFTVIFEEGCSGAPPGRLAVVCRLEDGLLSTLDVVPWRLKAMPFTYKLQWMQMGHSRKVSYFQD